MLTSAFVGMATRKIKVGPIALLLPLYDPIRLAEDSSYLNIVLNGRLRICFAAGYNPADLSLFEVNRGHLKNLFASTLRTVYRCWSESSSRSDRSDRLLSVTPKPATPIPILIGTWSHGGLKRALGSSGGWVCSTFVPMGHVERLLAYFRRHSKGENKKPYAACIRETWVDTNRKRALSVACKHHGRIHKSLLNSGNYPWRYPRGRIEDYVTDNMIVGDVDDCIEQVRKLRAIGFDEVICRFRQTDGPDIGKTVDSLKLFGSQIIPVFRRMRR